MTLQVTVVRENIPDKKQLLQVFSIKKVPGIYYAHREENQATKPLIHIVCIAAES